ncbi:hypothetical protein DPMN_169305 [Dreissena polymorpha]|uniref:G-protein coupled receptors family 1 profile domain-containing protein n=1 Tax=Dreissena polymorpha TaxID=45954 RepID=A0A9D4F2C1_DREPO|nr:hypothetical protein DPMN_169305 [Dreissena polymorpha]
MNASTIFTSTIVSRSDNDDMLVEFSCKNRRTYTVMALVTSAIVCVFTLFGNTLIIVSVVRFKRFFKTSLYVMIANLAASDLVLGLAMILMFVKLIVTDVQGNIEFCMAARVTVIVSYATSSMTLVCIAADRFMAVVFPLKHMLKTNQKKFFCGLMAATWIIPGTVIIAIAVRLTSGETKDIAVCRTGAINEFSVDVVSVVFMIIVIVVCTILYFIILWTVKVRPLKALAMRQHKKTVKKTLLMLAVSAVFVVCWLPFIISSIITSVSPSFERSASCVREFLIFLGYLNSSVNWVVYGLSNRKFRTAFRQIIMCRCCRTKISNNTLKAQSLPENAINSLYGLSSNIERISIQPVTLH